jgi:hypothetical protein
LIAELENEIWAEEGRNRNINIMPFVNKKVGEF